MTVTGNIFMLTMVASLLRGLKCGFTEMESPKDSNSDPKSAIAMFGNLNKPTSGAAATNTTFGAVNEDLPVSADCLACICESISRCSMSMTYGDDESSGPFAITKAYWKNSGKPTIKGMSPEDPDAFVTCTKSWYCSALAVQGYMKKHKRDCNRNGEFDCEDFALIHAYGRDGCLGTTLPTSIVQRYQQCIKFVYKNI